MIFTFWYRSFLNCRQIFLMIILINTWTGVSQHKLRNYSAVFVCLFEMWSYETLERPQVCSFRKERLRLSARRLDYEFAADGHGSSSWFTFLEKTTKTNGGLNVYIKKNKSTAHDVSLERLNVCWTAVQWVAGRITHGLSTIAKYCLYCYYCCCCYGCYVQT